MSHTLDVMVSAAARASELIMAVFARDFAVDYKSPRDPVTEADRLANAAICEHLAREFPGVPIVAEESDPEQYASFRDSDRIFFVDPLDGTAEFVARNDEFVVMIGLVQGDRATHGVVLSPRRETIWVGETGEGAHRIDRNGVRQSIAPTNIDQLTRARVVVSRSHRSAALEQALQAAKVAEIMQLGSAGLKSAYVAEGRADAYLSLGGAGKRWDVCGPDAVLCAAGGCFTDARGLPFDYRHADLTNSHGIAAAGAPLHAQIVLQEHAPSGEDNSHGKP